jgi:uracil-DNA glycosylase family 4
MIRNADCTDCALSKTARSVCISGRRLYPQTVPELGLLQQCDIAIVGDKPGERDDLSGRAFTGRIGDELHPRLSALGIRDYWVTNTVRCTSRGAPTATQVAACRHYLKEELAVVRPKYILALGNTAWHQFGKGPITEHAGKEIWHDGYAAWIMPTLHPDAVLRDPNKRGTWLNDLSRFAKLVRGELLTQPPVEIVRLGLPTVEAATTLVWLAQQHRSFTFDFEAIPIPWWHKDWRPISLAFSFSADKAYVVWLDGADYTDFFATLREVMLDPSISKTAHNMLYDDLVWTRLAGYQPFTTFDTMVAAQLLDENRPKGLKYLGRALLGWPQWDVDIRNQFDYHHNYALKMSREAVEEYNGYDTAATFGLRTLFLKELADEPRLLEYMQRLEMPKLRALERLMLRGIAVDQQEIERRLETSECVQHYHRLQIPVENPGSSQQVAKWLFGAVSVTTPDCSVGPNTTETSALAVSTGTLDLTLALTPVKLTDKGAASTDEESIKRLVQRYPEHQQIRHLLGYRGMGKMASTYFRPVGDAASQSLTQRFHPDYRSTSVETGRLGSFFHTTPRDSFVRSIFTARSGYILIQADFSQIEARIAAWSAAGKPERNIPAGSMLEAWFNDRDVYREQAAENLGKSIGLITKDERQNVGKVPVLASLYNITPKGLQEYAWRGFDLDWTDTYAQRIHAGFFRRWPEFRRWHERMGVLIRQAGFIESPIGRRRRLPAAQSRREDGVGWYTIQQAVNSGINHPIQSISSDITQAGMVWWERDYPHLGNIVGNVHDALLFEVPETTYHTSVECIIKVMLNAWTLLRPMGLRLPEGLLKVELTAGNWGAGKVIYS